MNTVDEHLGRMVRELRLAAHITASAFAHAIGVDEAEVAEIESGRKRMSATVIVAVCARLNVRPERLFEGFANSGPVRAKKADNVIDFVAERRRRS